jgi:pilus assembly protein CpaE
VAIASTLAQDARTRLLLIDGDLYAGPVRFLLKMGASASFLDALAHGDMLDEDMWRQMVANNGSLDVLHAGEHLPPPVLPTEQLGQVLALARKLYDVICVDLPGTFDPLSLGLLQESQRIFLITTAELTPLHFAKARLKQLGELGLQDRVSLVVNRHQARDQDHLTDEQVAQSVGIPVSFTFPNIYHSVQHAILEGNAVPQAGGMPEAVQALVHFMAPSHDQQSPQGGRKFLEFFRIPSGTAGSSPHP